MTDEPLSVMLTDSQSAYVDELVAKGDYATPDDVLRAGVEALKSRDGLFQNWLETEVFSVVDAIDADQSQTVPAEQVFEQLRARHEARFKSHG